jgi:sec-independent protein translocase protein TatB
MPSFQDSAFIILVGLLLFGPKGLAKIARQLGKLVGEFRRASAEFRMQMEDELRIAEQADQQKKIAAMEAAAPVPPPLGSDIPEPEHPHLPPPPPNLLATEPDPIPDQIPEHQIHAATPQPGPEPLPIATSGDLNLMPPPTGLPLGRSASSSSLSGVFDSIPHAADNLPDHAHAHAEQEATANG